jgi:undecaprenyl-diphosphatase
VVALGSFLAFVALAILVNNRGAIGLDAPLTAVVQGLPLSTDLWQVITAAGGVLLVPIGAAVVLGLLFAGRTRTAVIYGIALLGSSLWAHVVKVTIARERPPGAALIPAPGYSFPSAHALTSTVTYGLIGLLIWRSTWPRWARRVSLVALVGLIVLIGLSRIALGVHYPSDVVGGWLMGITIVAAVADLTDRQTGEASDDS